MPTPRSPTKDRTRAPKTRSSANKAHNAKTQATGSSDTSAKDNTKKRLLSKAKVKRKTKISQKPLASSDVTEIRQLKGTPHSFLSTPGLMLTSLQLRSMHLPRCTVVQAENASAELQMPPRKSRSARLTLLGASPNSRYWASVATLVWMVLTTIPNGKTSG